MNVIIMNKTFNELTEKVNPYLEKIEILIQEGNDTPSKWRSIEVEIKNQLRLARKVLHDLHKLAKTFVNDVYESEIQDKEYFVNWIVTSYFRTVKTVNNKADAYLYEKQEIENFIAENNL